MDGANLSIDSIGKFIADLYNSQIKQRIIDFYLFMINSDQNQETMGVVLTAVPFSIQIVYTLYFLTL